MMKMSPIEQQVFNHLGEVVLVYDAKYNLIWHHPDDSIFTAADGEYQSGIIVNFGDANDKHLAKFIISVDNDDDDIVNKVYRKKMDDECNIYFGDVDVATHNMFCAYLDALIIEDITAWGQAQFDEPYTSFMRNLREKAHGYNYTHDCGIHPASDYGYST